MALTMTETPTALVMTVMMAGIVTPMSTAKTDSELNDRCRPHIGASDRRIADSRSRINHGLLHDDRLVINHLRLGVGILRSCRSRLESLNRRLLLIDYRRLLLINRSRLLLLIYR